MSKYLYAIEFETRPDHWVAGGITRETLGYCEGWMACRRSEPGPSLATRLIRSDGHVRRQIAAKTEVSIGQHAGFPTWQQYARAGQRALDMALARSAQGRGAPEFVQRSLKAAIDLIASALAR